MIGNGAFFDEKMLESTRHIRTNVIFRHLYPESACIVSINYPA
jgi:hypothetical protein